jgi:hypothetical protein
MNVDYIQGIGSVVEFRQVPFQGFPEEYVTTAITTEGFIYRAVGDTAMRCVGRRFCHLKR